MHAHTHAARGALECESSARDETLGEPEEPRWTKSQDTYIRICIAVHTCIYTLGEGMRSWTNYVFHFSICFFPKKQSKRCGRNTETRIRMYFSYIDSQLKVLSYF